MQYYKMLEDLLRQMHKVEDPDRNEVSRIISGFCEMMNIARVDITFFVNVNYEEANKGEKISFYNTDKPCELAVSKRIMGDKTGISLLEIYRFKDIPEWSDDERERVELIFDTVVFFIRRARLTGTLEKLMYHDDDGYKNLRYYRRYLNQTANDLAGMVAIHFNLRHFSLVNQQIGRVGGNYVMRRYYLQLAELIGDKGCVCRLGGDNFILCCAKEQLEDIIDYLSNSSVEYDPNTHDHIKIYTSVGVYIIPDKFIYKSHSDVLDKIMFASLVARKNSDETVVYYNKEMLASREHTMWIQQLFPEALASEEFKVFYQPKIDIVSGELKGAEALCRWFHNGKMISPADFIPVLEQGMEICRLDFYMLDHVCKDIRRWIDEGKKVVRVSVNLSRKHMIDVDLLKHLIEIVDRNNVPHEYIEIELTETTTDVEFRDLKRIVNGLQDEGICTSVDDFGMGYSSLNLIKEIPWDVIKVDRSFLPVDEDTENSTRSIMFKYVVAMAKEMGLECIAEGVETHGQIDILRENSCNLAQGFYFDKPLPIKEFEVRLDKPVYMI